MQKKGMDSYGLQNIRTELKMYRMIDCPYIVKFLGSYESNTEFCFVQELMENGDLYQNLKQNKYFNEKQAANCIFDILKGLQYLKTLDIVHRDIKLKNVLCNYDGETKYKLCDFGISNFKPEVENSPKCGTPGYISPEIFKFKIH